MISDNKSRLCVFWLQGKQQTQEPELVTIKEVKMNRNLIRIKQRLMIKLRIELVSCRNKKQKT